MENGHSGPNKAVQLRLYEISRDQTEELEDLIQKVSRTGAGDRIRSLPESGRQILDHRFIVHSLI